MRTWTWCVVGVLATTASLGCSKTTEPGSQDHAPGSVPNAKVVRPTVPAGPGESAVPEASATPSAVAPAPSPPPLNKDAYPWLADERADRPEPVESIEVRLSPPAGFTRVQVAPGSFGAWLRGLPLAAPGTPVRKFSGGVLLDGNHDNVASVIAIDAGKADLQQCADSVIRLHAEWMWSQGRRDMSYQAAAGTALPYARWARGERVVQKGMGIQWVPSSGPSSDHGSFRQFLDAVFAWANTGSLERQAKKVGLEELRPGDFVIQPGNPGHAVLFLDVATRADGSRVALMGQGYMPAQGIYVLRPAHERTWFEIRPDEGAIRTPFWEPFPWSSLRRLDGD